MVQHQQQQLGKFRLRDFVLLYFLKSSSFFTLDERERRRRRRLLLALAHRVVPLDGLANEVFQGVGLRFRSGPGGEASPFPPLSLLGRIYTLQSMVTLNFNFLTFIHVMCTTSM